MTSFNVYKYHGEKPLKNQGRTQYNISYRSLILFLNAQSKLRCSAFVCIRSSILCQPGVIRYSAFVLLPIKVYRV